MIVILNLLMLHKPLLGVANVLHELHQPDISKTFFCLQGIRGLRVQLVNSVTSLSYTGI